MRQTASRHLLILAVIVLGLTSCETVRHQFAGPARDWQARSYEQ